MNVTGLISAESCRLTCSTALSFVYHRTIVMLTTVTEPSDHATMQFICNKVAAAGFRSLILPAVQPSDSD